MKCTVEKDLLLTHLQKVCNAAAAKSTLPILGNLRLEARDDALTLTATDLEIKIDTQLKANVKRAGITTIPARSLAALVSRLKDAELTFDCGKNFHTAIRCGNAEVILKGLDPAGFPDAFHFEPKRKLSLLQAELSRMIHSVYYAVDLDDSRKVLHGISFSVKDGKLSMAATDGKRLALVEDQTVESSGDGDVILPLRTAQELQRLLGQEGTVEIELSDIGIQVRLDDTRVFSKLLEGNYLNYRPIIPAESAMELSVPCDDVRESLMLLAMPLAAKSANIKLSFRQNELEFFLRNDNTGEGKDRVKVDYDQDEAIEMTINLQFLLDPFKNLEDLTFRFKINDSVSPVMLENDKGFRYIIMPIRVQ